MKELIRKSIAVVLFSMESFTCGQSPIFETAGDSLAQGWNQADFFTNKTANFWSFDLVG